MKPIIYTRGQALPAILEQRIAILDGAMGTMIQRFKLTEADYRGERFKDHPKDLKNNGDLLSLTRPDVIRDIHEGYLAAGADIIETNTFGATRIAQDDYGLGHLAREMNVASAEAGARGGRQVLHARQAALRRRRPGPDAEDRQHQPGRERPGAPATSTSSSCARPTTSRSKALVEGGVDLLLVETIFDTLNAKAALFAIDEYFEQSGERLPLIISGTVTDASGRILSGQTVTAFWYSVRHAQPLAVGLNCALGAALMRPYIQELARVAPRHLHQLLPQRRPAQSDERHRLRRNAGRHLAAAARVRGRRAGEHRGRLLRHHAGAHRAPSGEAVRAAADALAAARVLLQGSGLSRRAARSSRGGPQRAVTRWRPCHPHAAGKPRPSCMQVCRRAAGESLAGFSAVIGCPAGKSAGIGIECR